MSFRVPQTLQNRRVLLDLQGTKERLALNQDRLATGKRIVTPGDDPTGSALILDFASSIDTNAQYLRQADSAASYLSAAENVLDGTTNSVTRLLELAQQAQSGTQSASSRAAISTEVDGIRTNLIAFANTQEGGKYIFAGSRTLTQPFSGPAAGPITYAGDGTTLQVDVTRTSSIGTNIPGDALFFGTGGQGSATDLFQQVTDLRDALTTNNPAAIATAATNLKAILGSVTQFQTDIGGRQATLSGLKDSLSGYNLTLQGIQNNLQDVDYPTTITQFQTDQTAQSVTLSALSKGSKQNLFDFLG